MTEKSSSVPKVRIGSTLPSAVIPESANLPYKTMSGMFAHLERACTDFGGDPLGLSEQAAETPYAICLVPRSGSTFLTHLLKETKCFGFPDEWLGLPEAETQARETGATDWDSLLKRILSRHASPNGVSGVELALAHITWGREATGRQKLLDPEMRYFYLRRRNIVRQAISMHVAHQSGVLHSFQMNDDARTVRDAVLYDAGEIRSWIKFLQDEELKWEREFGSLGIEPVRIYYEDLIARPERIVRLFSNVLGLPATPTVKDSPIERVGTSRTDEWETRYREEDARFLEALARHRPLVHIPGPAS